MTPILLGLLSSVVTSAVKWVNDKLSNTALQGEGAQILAVLVSLVGSAGYMAYNHQLDLSNYKTAIYTFTAMYATADIYYKFFVERFFK
jgi:hypothetical protein